MRAQMPGGQVLFTPQVQAAWWDRVGGAVPFCPGLTPALQGWVAVSRVQGCSHPALCVIWEHRGCGQEHREEVRVGL